ncbi:hypothetical protein CHU_2559 [Cytophaga hutchinsonii ATCC 33406]|uniref:Uncharacterized protein n=1 Tax=Cytophaga hutchinsonii (strain ATCC 33406 / DSM 1761 / CIP 103989 / NBRC 15051 / NCIMB 9469 / D465) TaxID=269798 RepID=A0A6N4STN0_CYTH3|nr:hypothetical protein CHU_2559 [Cytophaga hutchinsonii ATCC 33406]
MHMDNKHIFRSFNSKVGIKNSIGWFSTKITREMSWFFIVFISNARYKKQKDCRL